MEELWSNDRATGSGQRTTRLASRQVHTENLSVDLGDHNMDYISEPPEFNVADHELPCSPVAHVQSTDSPSNTPSAPSQPSGGTSSSRGSKRKGPMVDVIENQFNMLNTNLQNCVASMNRGNDVIDEVLAISRVQATSSQEIAAEIKRRNDYYGEHVQNDRRKSSYQYSPSDIWSMLIDLNIQDEAVMDQCYDFLCENPAIAMRVFGMPKERRMAKLFNIMTRRQ